MATARHIEMAAMAPSTAPPSKTISNESLVPVAMGGLELEELNIGDKPAVVFRAMQQVDEHATDRDDRLKLYQMIFGIDDHTNPRRK